MSGKIRSRERETRLKLLKRLAYHHEHLSEEEVLSQYSNFMGKIEKGVFHWGSDDDLRTFDHQLLYAISIDARKRGGKRVVKSGTKDKFDNRKKYCLDFNRGNCKITESHEGKLHGQQVFKLHICRRCLVEDGIEAKHPEVECNNN